MKLALIGRPLSGKTTLASLLSGQPYDPAGTFQAGGTFATGGFEPTAVAVGRVNGDNNLDLVVTNGFTGTVSVLLGNGNGTFQAARTFASGGVYPRSVALGDFNGDGRQDVAATNFDSDTVSVAFAPATTDPGEKDFVTVGPGAAATVREAVLEAALDTATAATEPLIAPAAVDTP